MYVPLCPLDLDSQKRQRRFYGDALYGANRRIGRFALNAGPHQADNGRYEPIVADSSHVYTTVWAI